MAADGELAEVARYAVRRLRVSSPSASPRSTDNKFQIQLFAAGEIVPGLQVLDAVQNGTVEMGNTALYYYFGKDPAFTFGTALPFGLNTRADERLAALRRRQGAAERASSKKYNCIGFPAGNTGAQMGGWFRKEIKTVDDLKGLKFRIGGFAGTHAAKLGVVPQQIAARRHLSGAGEGHDRRRRMGRPLRRREARLLQGRAVLLLSGLVGRLRPAPQPHQHREVERAAEDLPGHGRVSVGLGRDLGWSARTTTSIRPALKRCCRSGAQLRPFPQPVMEACYKAADEIYARSVEDQPDVQEDV